MKINTDTEFGKRVASRLQEEQMIWLTTTGSDGAPQPRPVWFLWDEETFLIFSRPGGAKMKHISNNHLVAMHLDGNGKGGDIVVLIGEATIDDTGLRADEVADYVEKYSAGMKRLGMTAAQFSETYSAVIRVVPNQLRGH
jgi:PPOX class probable F420-dependent enzyme